MNIRDEADQNAVGVLTVIIFDAVWSVVGVVIDLLDDATATESGTVEAFFTPEWVFVNGMDLDDKPHRNMLVGHHLFTRQSRYILDAVVEIRWHRQNGVFRFDNDLVFVGGNLTGSAVIGNAIAHISGNIVKLIGGCWIRSRPVELTNRGVEEYIVAKVFG